MASKLCIASFFYCRPITTIKRENMSIFKKAPAKELPPLLNDAEIYGATYDQVIDFLVAVNDKDYQKIVKVADAHRANAAEVAKITGIKYGPVPSIFEQQTVAPVTAPGTVDDDDLDLAFLTDDEPAAPKPVKRTKVEVKNAS